ncbi:hypothetical protein CFK37_11040 [Virgibacillus phasianinus]|uniref:LrgB family protein n=1 Tax=Virgibacillus phasianinus TaxID=2017483 RepID=A0A220U3B3_9BACI|nr:LrgB family protein [Virgibacillus phasianinus]ASK62648.1 hypothetical protein CFK37_11040 [Virgibacillus phasianinus]
MQQTLYTIIMILFTIGVFLMMVRLYARFHIPVFIPILTSTITIVSVLLVFGVSYNSYMIGGKWIDALLGPAVVSLAYPLYKQRKMIVEHMFPILAGVFVGSCAAMVSGYIFAKAFGVGRDFIISLIPKSITTPVAIQISSVIGGIPSITVVFVMIAGFTGVLIGPSILKWARIESPMGKGIAFGNASHAIGTSKALEYGELTVSMSSVAMTLSAIFGSVLGPLFVWLFQI